MIEERRHRLRHPVAQIARIIPPILSGCRTGTCHGGGKKGNERVFHNLKICKVAVIVLCKDIRIGRFESVIMFRLSAIMHNNGRERAAGAFPEDSVFVRKRGFAIFAMNALQH